MKTFMRAVLAAAIVAAAGSVGPAAAAARLDYRCASSTRDIDDTSYDGPWPDNWKITVKTCAARSGGTVYAYAEARWNGPGFYPADDTSIFDGAKLRVQIKASRPGTDPVLAERDFAGIEDRLEDSSSGADYRGSYRTATISHRAGAGALADTVLFLDWQGDGRGYQRHDVTASPTV
ncbi:hypothetical protein ACIGD1_34405 [Streptomyces sp. NPDC085612]|uniref:hypothetical protein n=1 Tax=Streptomyces sp. NPDC085612 TaxID=3365732 RepID=UPI0037CFD191